MEQTNPKKNGIDEKLKQLSFPGEARRVTSSWPFCVPVLQNETIGDKEQPDSDRKLMPTNYISIYDRFQPYM